MDLPAFTGELIGQEMTIDCSEQDDDFYMGQVSVDLSTEYDFTKGVDITFDGQLYKNVPVAIETIDFDDYLLIGEFVGQQPILNKYPFFISLMLYSK